MKFSLRMTAGILVLASIAFGQAPVKPPVTKEQSQVAPAQSAPAQTPAIQPAGARSPAPPPAIQQSSQDQNATSTVAPKYTGAPSAVFWLIFGVMTAVILFGIGAVGVLLRSDKDWTFADAMSGADGKPSTSRLVAFLGLLVIIAVILGVGYSSLWVFLQTGQLPSLAGVSTFLLACAGLFTPYFANQIGLALGSQTSSQSLAPVVTQTANSNLQFGTLSAPNITFGAPTRPPV